MKTTNPVAQKKASALRGAERDTWQARGRRAERHLSNLLAVIHRDGGHYQLEHGTDKAVADAIRLSSIRIDREEPTP